MIKIKDCRGDDKKRALIRKYKIRPIAYIKLLNNQKKYGCCGKLKDKYYAFEAIDEKAKKKGSFFVGYECGKRFLELLEIDKKDYPKLFNPLKNQTNIEKMDIINREVYNAIMIITMSWNGSPYGDYANIINFIRNFVVEYYFRNFCC